MYPAEQRNLYQNNFYAKRQWKYSTVYRTNRSTASYGNFSTVAYSRPTSTLCGDRRKRRHRAEENEIYQQRNKRRRLSTDHAWDVPAEVAWATPHNQESDQNYKTTGTGSDQSHSYFLFYNHIGPSMPYGTTLSYQTLQQRAPLPFLSGDTTSRTYPSRKVRRNRYRSERVRETMENIIATSFKRYKRKQGNLNDHLKHLKSSVTLIETNGHLDPTWRENLAEVEILETFIDKLRESIALDLVQISAQMVYEPLVERGDDLMRELSEVLRNSTTLSPKGANAVVNVNINAYPIDGFDGKASDYFRSYFKILEEVDVNLEMKSDDDSGPKKEQIKTGTQVRQDACSRLHKLPKNETNDGQSSMHLPADETHGDKSSIAEKHSEMIGEPDYNVEVQIVEDKEAVLIGLSEESVSIPLIGTHQGFSVVVDCELEGEPVNEDGLWLDLPEIRTSHHPLQSDIPANNPHSELSTNESHKIPIEISIDRTEVEDSLIQKDSKTTEDLPHDELQIVEEVQILVDLSETSDAGPEDLPGVDTCNGSFSIVIKREPEEDEDAMWADLTDGGIVGSEDQPWDKISF